LARHFAPTNPVIQDVLSGEPPTGPIWRASPARILEGKTFSVVAGTTSEKWSASQLDKFQIEATVVPVENYAAGIQSVLDRNSDVFFGDRSILLEAAAASGSADDLIVLDRLFTYELLALPLARDDEDFRLIVDRGLSKFFASPEFRLLYQKWFGTPDESALTFYRFNILPE
jgi:polar amino acid transport system substrate-binding protein